MTTLTDIDLIEFNPYGASSIVAKFEADNPFDNFYFARKPFANPGDSSRPNVVMSWGANLAVGGRVDTSAGACATGFAIESRYVPDGAAYAASELHIYRIDPNQPSTVRRPWSWEFREGGAWQTEICVDEMLWYDRAGTAPYARIQKDSFQLLLLEDEGVPSAGFRLRTILDNDIPLTLFEHIGSSVDKIRFTFGSLEVGTATAFGANGSAKIGGLAGTDDRLVLASSVGNLSASLPHVYDEWTPQLRGSSTSGTPTYTAQEAYVCQFGPLVYIQGRVSISNKGGMAGGLQLANLPIPVKTTDNSHSSGGVTFTIFSGPTHAASYTQWVGAFTSGGTVASVVQQGSGMTTTGLSVTDVPDVTTIGFFGFYLTE